MTSIDAQVEAWQRVIAPMQMAQSAFGTPLHIESGGGESHVAEGGAKLAGYGAPNVASDAPFDWQHAPELVLTDNNHIYWWAVGNPYQVQDGASGYFAEVIDPNETSIDPFDPSHPLTPIGGPVGAQLTSTNAPYAFPTEAQLYLVDPALFASFFQRGQDDDLPTKSSIIADVVGGPYTATDQNCSYVVGGKADPRAAMPPALSLLAPDQHALNVLLHPNSLNPYGPPTTDSSLAYSDFYQNAPPPAPNEVRAVKLQAPGICTSEILLEPLYYGGEGINKGLFSILQDTITKLCDKPIISGAALNYLFGTPVIDRDPNTSAPKHGFFLNIDISLQASLAKLLGLGCNLRASALYDVKVEDGALRFSVSRDPEHIRIDAYSGGGCDSINAPIWLIALAADMAAAPVLAPIGGPLASAGGEAALAALEAMGGLFLAVEGPNSIVREVLMARFIRQELNQIIRSQLGMPIGDYGNYLYSQLGSPQGLSPELLNEKLDGACDPTAATPDEFIEDGDGDVPGDRHVTRSSAAGPVKLMCRLTRQGFMQTHAPNGPPVTLDDLVSQGFNTSKEDDSQLDPCMTLVSDSSMWFRYNQSHPSQVNASPPSVANTDEVALEFLLRSLLETETNGKTLKHWRCPTPCDPSDNTNMSMDLIVRDAVGQLRLDSGLSAEFRGCSAGGCKSTLSSVLGDPANTFGRFLGCGADPLPNATPADKTQSLITFYPPIRRMIVNPDGIQLVFVDNESDFNNAALAFRYALAALDAFKSKNAPSSTPTAYGLLEESSSRGVASGLVGKLCSYQRPGGSRLMREWATLRWPIENADSPIPCGQPNRACVPQHCKQLGDIVRCGANGCSCGPDPSNPDGGWGSNPVYHACVQDSDCPTSAPKCRNGACSKNA